MTLTATTIITSKRDFTNKPYILHLQSQVNLACLLACLLAS
jgi:hypothetical protein